MTRTKTKKWDPAKHLDTTERIVAYLDAALEDSDPAVVAAALGDVARAKGMSEVAADARLGRESLYKALSQDGNPEFGTILRVIKALRLRLSVLPTREPVRRKRNSA
jgi:probable addiction module antidote protein